MRQAADRCRHRQRRSARQEAARRILPAMLGRRDDAGDGRNHGGGIANGVHAEALASSQPKLSIPYPKLRYPIPAAEPAMKFVHRRSFRPPFHHANNPSAAARRDWIRLCPDLQRPAPGMKRSPVEHRKPATDGRLRSTFAAVAVGHLCGSLESSVPRGWWCCFYRFRPDGDKKSATRNRRNSNKAG